MVVACSNLWREREGERGREGGRGREKERGGVREGERGREKVEMYKFKEQYTL